MTTKKTQEMVPRRWYADEMASHDRTVKRLDVARRRCDELVAENNELATEYRNATHELFADRRKYAGHREMWAAAYDAVYAELQRVRARSAEQEHTVRDLRRRVLLPRGNS